ncbi:MAG: hypothetical protein IJ844_03070 [Prevotella sp.]|nr:hypothetical protein [Prevotella sp.]
MKRHYVLLLLAATMLFGGCGLVWVCVERPSDIANAYKYTDQHPLTADGLKHLLIDDTAHYKVVGLHSLCCGSCHEQLRYTYSKLWDKDTANVRWYFVLEDCSSLKYDHTKYLRSFGIETPYMYYLRDDDPRFCTGADDRHLNIAQYIFDHDYELEDVHPGIPTLFIVNPQGKLKKEYRRYADSTVVVGNVEYLGNLLYSQIYPKYIPLESPKGIRDIDFDSRDTADWSDFGSYTRKPKYCTPEGCF